MSKKIKVAVIVGDHDYDVPNFQKAFESMDGVETYIQNLQEFTTSEQKTRDWYDVLLFYNYHLTIPTKGSPYNMRAVLDTLGETGQPILILHHAVLAYPDWSKWSDICGMQDRSFNYHDGQNVDFKIIKKHTITEGVKDFSMTDETYEMKSAEAADGNDVLVTTDHPLSAKTILWTRTHKKSKVVCYSSGHDDSAFANPNFRKLVENSIKWLMTP